MAVSLVRVAALLPLLISTTAQAQLRWVVDSRASLAWWQMNPHLSHLWATTCPEDPSWQPGEAHEGGTTLDHSKRIKVPYAAHDEARIPLYPREKVESVCTPAITGTVSVVDSTGLRGVRGTIVIRAEHLRTGLRMRDAYARRSIYETDKHPEIRFDVDSVVDVMKGDTLRALAVGTMQVRGKSKPMKVPVEAWPEAGGLRVRGRFFVPAAELVDVFGISPYALGLGIGLRVWKTLHMGIDLVLRPEGAAPSGPA